jgi:phosphomevalonate kinase
VAALDVEARVTLTIAPGTAPLVVESAIEGRWSADDGTPPPGDAAALVAALDAAATRLPSLAGARVRAAVDTRAFVRGDRKLGLGRSAATLSAAVAGLLGSTDAHDVLALALAANARLQRGLGSGADVAAAVHGGLVAVRRQGEGLEVAPRALPRDLHLLVGWTGDAAPTVPLLERFAAADRPAALGGLAAAAERAAAAAADGDAAGLLDAVDRSAAALAALGVALGLPIVTPALARLVETARRAGAAAKPAGAGGGDCGIALARCAQEAEQVRVAWRAAGIVPLDVGIAPAGVRTAVTSEAIHEAALG